MAWYLAYGEDMDEAVLKELCPSAKKVTLAMSPETRFEFLRHNGEVYLDLVPAKKQELWGVLYFIEDTELMNVRARAPKVLRVRFRPVWDPDSKGYNAYLLEGDAEGEVVPPPKEIMDKIWGCAVAHGLPEKYLKGLDQIRPKK